MSLHSFVLMVREIFEELIFRNLDRMFKEHWFIIVLLDSIYEVFSNQLTDRNHS